MTDLPGASMSRRLALLVVALMAVIPSASWRSCAQGVTAPAGVGDASGAGVAWAETDRADGLAADVEAATRELGLPADLLGDLSAEEIAALAEIRAGVKELEAQVQETVVRAATDLPDLKDIFRAFRYENPDKYTYNDGGRRDPFYPLIVPTLTPTATRTPWPTTTATLPAELAGAGTPTNTPSFDTPTPTMTMTATNTPVPRPPLTVTGIWVGEGERRVAVVDNTLLEVGDEIAGATVTEITADEITVVYYSVEFKFPIREEDDPYY
jgi:hypothetical protein